MARARNIKPAFFQNEVLAELPFEHRLLFIGLWTLADKKGRLEDRPKRVKMGIFPADDVDVERGIAALCESKFIYRYSIDGVKYIQIITWEKHQTPHHTEKDSVIPPPINRYLTVDSPLVNGKCLPDSLIPDSLIPDSIKTDAPKKSARFDALKISLPDCIPLSAWIQWIEYRRKRKLSTTEQTAELQIANLVTWHAKGHDPTQVIANSVSNGWQGLFEPKNGNNYGNGKQTRHDQLAATAAALTSGGSRVIDSTASRVD